MPKLEKSSSLIFFSSMIYVFRTIEFLKFLHSLGRAVVRFVSEGVAYPPKLRQGVFTTAAVDNVDHNPSSTTSKSSFHGTGISIFQHHTDDNDGVERDAMIFKTDKPTTNQISELPDEYTNMKPASLKSKPVPPGSTIQFVGIQNHEYLT
jgi:hypothetical protein